MNINLEEAKQKALKLLEEELLEQKDFSGVHSKSHLLMAANLSQLVGKIYNYTDNELFLSYFASLFHDIVRSPSQNMGLDDEKLSAQEAVTSLEQFPVSEQEKTAVYYAIQKHSDHPSWMSDSTRRNNPPESLNEKVRFALFVADKLEQNGVRVIARRSAFVAGERLLKPTGDLQAFGFKPENILDKLKVVASESVIRLTILNPENIYPDKLKSLVEPLYDIQRQFVYGIFKALNINVENLAKLLLETKRADRKNLLSARGVNQFPNIDSLSKAIKSIGQISDQEIKSISDAVIKASTEAVEYFSSNYEKDIDNLMLNWQPQNSLAKQWQRQMVEYLNGTWYKSVENKLNE